MGIGFVSIGVLLFGGWDLYYSTRNYEPFKMPVRMSTGQLRTKQFTVNINTTYEIEIEVDKRIPFDTLNCLLGMEQDEKTCATTSSVIDAEWTLRSDGRIVQHGSSSDDRGGAWAAQTISREIGHFDGRTGHKYDLEINILTDGTRLSAGNPRLIVSVNSGFVEGALFTTGLIVTPAAGILVLVGVALLLVSVFLAWRRRKLAHRASLV